MPLLQPRCGSAPMHPLLYVHPRGCPIDISSEAEAPARVSLVRARQVCAFRNERSALEAAIAFPTNLNCSGARHAHLFTRIGRRIARRAGLLRVLLPRLRMAGWVLRIWQKYIPRGRVASAQKLLPIEHCDVKSMVPCPRVDEVYHTQCEGRSKFHRVRTECDRLHRQCGSAGGAESRWMGECMPPRAFEGRTASAVALRASYHG